MTRTALLAASAALSVLCLSSGAEAGECLRGDRVWTPLSTAVERTDRLFQLRRRSDVLLGSHAPPRITQRR